MRKVIIELLIVIAILGVICVMVLQSGMIFAAKEAAQITESPSFIPGMTPQEIAEQDVVHIITYEEFLEMQENSKQNEEGSNR